MMSMTVTNIAILNFKGCDCRCIIGSISKNEPINFNAKCQFNRKKRNIIKNKKSLSRIKMGKEILTFGDVEIQKNKFYPSKTSIFFKGCR